MDYGYLHLDILGKGVSQEPFKNRTTDKCEVRSSVLEQTEQWPLSVQCTGLSGSQPLTLCNAANILISLCLTQPRPGLAVQCTVSVYCTVHCGVWRGIHPLSTATRQQHWLGQRSVCCRTSDWSVEKK